MKKFAKLDAVPVHKQVAEYLKDNIVSGTFAPSSRLPSERELASKLKVSRETLRKSIDSLCYEGLLVRRSGKGTFVMDVKGKNLPGIEKVGLIFSWGDMGAIEEDSYFGQVFRSLKQNQPERCEVNAIFYKRETGLFELFYNNGFEGMIIVAPRIEMKSELIKLRQVKIPCVIYNASFYNTTLDYIDSDNVGGAMTAVEYLANLKHKNIGFIGSNSSDTNAVDRLKGYKLGLKQQGLEYREKLVSIPSEGESLGDAVSRGVKGFLSLKPRPTAILFYSCTQAMKGMEVIKNRGLKIPDDISVICFDDPKVASYTQPPLTVIKEPLEEMARVALKELMRRITGSPSKSVQVNLKTELIKRGSCSLAKGNGKNTGRNQ